MDNTVTEESAERYSVGPAPNQLLLNEPLIFEIRGPELGDMFLTVWNATMRYRCMYNPVSQVYTPSLLTI